MKRYVRGKVLAGQIISLVVFTIMMIGFFALAYAARLNNVPALATLSNWMGFFSLVEMAVAIFGIVQSVRSYGEFKIATAIISAVFDGLLGLLLFVGLFQSTGITNQNNGNVIFLLGLAAAMVLLIWGAVQGKRESSYSLKAPRYVPTQNTPFGGANAGFVPSAVPAQPTSSEPAVASTASPDAVKIASDLAALKNLYDQQLITEQEYTEKKRQILDREFFAK